MNNNCIPIGKIVADELERQGHSVQWLADQVPTSLQNCYKMLRATSLNTEVLRTLSIALNHNFFADYATLLELPQNSSIALRLASDPNLHNEFNALVEPYIKRAGYKGKIKNEYLIVWIGDPKIEIYHWKDVPESQYEYVSLLIRIKEKSFKNLSWYGRVLMANELSYVNAHFGVGYEYKKKEIHVRYNCCVYNPSELVLHLDICNACFCNLYERFQELLPQIEKDFPND